MEMEESKIKRVGDGLEGLREKVVCGWLHLQVPDASAPFSGQGCRWKRQPWGGEHDFLHAPGPGGPLPTWLWRSEEKVVCTRILNDTLHMNQKTQE